MSAAKKTLYEILGVPRDANDIDIGLAHAKHHAQLQDATPQDPGAQSLLHQAYEVLADPRRRAAYDASLLSAAERSAAAQQPPDLVLEADDTGERARRKKALLPMLAGAAIAVLAAIFLLRSPKPPVPRLDAVVEAPKPAAPLPPKPRSTPEILADAVTSSGKVLGYEMSGRAVPIGLAMSVDAGTMVTTCHGLAAGSKIIVQVGSETLAADLTITDETLDLCRLSVPGFTTRPLAIATDEAKAGDRIFAVGMNQRGELALTEGTIKKVMTVPAGNVLEVSMPIAPAGSGGPVFNEFGKVVGIATTPHAYGSNLHIVLPISWVSQMRSRGRTK